MIIRLKVFEQTLSIVDTKSVPRKGSKDYLVLHFLFSSDWDDLNKVCYLQNGEVSQPIDVVDNLVEVPEWFTEQDSFDVTLFGKSGSKEVPTNVVSLRLEKSNTLWEKNAPEPQPSWLAKVIDLNNHPSIPGQNGFWLIWDTDSGTYVESKLPLPGAGLPDGGTVGQLLSKTESGAEWINPPQSGVQPDWNQNDSTAADYIKNRPFYAGDPGETVLVEESTVSFVDNRGKYMGQLESTFSATVGETYKVSWDGAVYESACVDFHGMTLIGNLALIGPESDTGEPFVMMVENGKRIQIRTADTSASHIISISGYIESVVKINPKYLPMASETEPGIVMFGDLANGVLQQVENKYFTPTDFPVSGYGDSEVIKECADKNNGYCVFIPGGKSGGVVLSCHNDTTNKYITSVLAGGADIKCYKISQGVSNIEQLWGISEDGVIIPSSTANSTKKFKITVDDSGTLKATEVT